MKPWMWVLVWSVVGFCIVAPVDVNAALLYSGGMLVSGLGVVGFYETRKG